MKITAHLLCLLLPACTSFSQTQSPTSSTEFGASENGLIYSNKAIGQLKHIVDSLSLKFKVCELNKTYLSVPQAKAHYITLSISNVRDARKDMDDNMPFEAFMAKYPSCSNEKDLLITRDSYEGYQHKQYTSFRSISTNDRTDHSIELEGNPAKYQKPLKGRWIYSYYGKSEYSAEEIRAFYFTEEFKQISLPEKYARMVQYTDCLVDTTAEIFYDKAKQSGVRYKANQAVTGKGLLAYIDQHVEPVPLYDEKNADVWDKLYQAWQKRKDSLVTNVLSQTGTFKTLLAEAVTYINKNGGSNDELEQYVEAYYSPKVALEMKRNRIVIGGCSQDMSPRIHALNIARLSAETTNWETFLRAHLDIMNDRFQRASDGSYAWKERKTYIKELEVLDINVPDLLLGVSLRVSNPSQRHYFGSINRIGRALSESGKPAEIEERMLAMITDTTLDNYNRVLAYYLFVNYTYNLEDKNRQKENQNRLDQAAKTFPDFIANRPDVKKEPKGKSTVNP
jgi:hypothetical protein